MGALTIAMKKSKFTESQIVFALQQAETGVAVAEVCHKLGISEPLFTTGRRSTAGWARSSCAACASWKKRTRS
jgi:putative transposase